RARASRRFARLAPPAVSAQGGARGQFAGRGPGMARSHQAARGRAAAGRHRPLQLPLIGPSPLRPGGMKPPSETVTTGSGEKRLIIALYWLGASGVRPIRLEPPRPEIRGNH